MRIVLLGAPGAGKGTQAKLLCRNFNIPHVSTGDIMRAQIVAGTDIGKQLEPFLNSGRMVPDELTLLILKERLSREDCKAGFLLDGFPRNLYQAEELDFLLQSTKSYLDKVIFMKVPEKVIIDRVSGRRLCMKCGASYNITSNPSRAGNCCEHCGGSLILRQDDKPQVVEERLKIYHASVQHLVDFYSAKGIMQSIEVKESQNVEEVFADICSNLKKAAI